jgi:hypothetical protein
VDLLQSLNNVVQGSHHLHLELEELLWSQGWPVPWLFCPCWPEPVPVLLVFTICSQQNKIYKGPVLYNSRKKTLAG